MMQTPISDAELMKWYNSGLYPFFVFSTIYTSPLPKASSPDEVHLIYATAFSCWGREVRTFKATARALYHTMVVGAGSIYADTCVINRITKVLQLLAANNFVGLLQEIKGWLGGTQLTGAGYTVTLQLNAAEITAAFRGIVNRDPIPQEFAAAFPGSLSSEPIFTVTRPEYFRETVIAARETMGIIAKPEVEQRTFGRTELVNEQGMRTELRTDIHDQSRFKLVNEGVPVAKTKIPDQKEADKAKGRIIGGSAALAAAALGIGYLILRR
jgi:hypothetical protein